MKPVNRRTFLRNSAAVAGTVALSRSARAAQPGANERIRVGVVGIRGRGQRHIDDFEAIDGVEVVALCDVDEKVLGEKSDKLDQKTGRKCKRFVDFRKMLDDKEIDAISIATPNHWHTLMAIWSMQAGKDVYVEKPVSHNIWEGRQLVNAARKYNCICQAGTQGRSSPAIQEGIKQLKAGVIGDVYMAKGLCYKWRDTIGHTPNEDVPPGVHYDKWLGPAPQRPFSRNRFHYNWHWHWDYGNGDIGNQGVHEMDLARWGLGVGLPKAVQSMGSKFMFEDDQETPNTLLTSYFYPDTNQMLVFEVRHWITNHEGDLGWGSPDTNNVGTIFYGTEGYMTLKYFNYKTFLGKMREPGPSHKDEWGDHFENFITAMRSRKIGDLTAEIEEGHISSAMCHLANIAYLVGDRLEFDPKRERFANSEKANKLLTRDYREPYVVPQIS
jgi:predicted dehydrogenase